MEFQNWNYSRHRQQIRVRKIEVDIKLNYNSGCRHHMMVSWNAIKHTNLHLAASEIIEIDNAVNLNRLIYLYGN